MKPQQEMKTRHVTLHLTKVGHPPRDNVDTSFFLEQDPCLTVLKVSLDAVVFACTDDRES